MASSKKTDDSGDKELHRCSICKGTGLCQACSPPGSGKSVKGEICSSCGGSGRCPCH